MVSKVLLVLFVVCNKCTYCFIGSCLPFDLVLLKKKRVKMIIISLSCHKYERMTLTEIWTKRGLAFEFYFQGTKLKGVEKRSGTTWKGWSFKTNTSLNSYIQISHSSKFNASRRFRKILRARWSSLFTSDMTSTKVLKNNTL